MAIGVETRSHYAALADLKLTVTATSAFRVLYLQVRITTSSLSDFISTVVIQCIKFAHKPQKTKFTKNFFINDPI